MSPASRHFALQILISGIRVRKKPRTCRITLYQPFQDLLGTPLLLEYFEVIGVSGTDVGSVAAVLRSLRDICVSVNDLPLCWGTAAKTCRKLIVLAGVRCFEEGGLQWRHMLNKVSHTQKPTRLVLAQGAAGSGTWQKCR